MIVYLGSNKLKEAYIGSQKIKEIRVGDKRVFPEGYVPTSNTLFYITNNGEITDHSPYSHTMQWGGSSSFETLSTGQKVAKFTGSNVVYCSNFTESIGYTTFTFHERVKLISNLNDYSFGGRMGRDQSSSSTSQRWGAKLQNDSGYSNNMIIRGQDGYADWNRSSYFTAPSTSVFQLWTFTFNGGSYAFYKNGVLSVSGSGRSITGGINGKTTFAIGGTYSYNGSFGQYCNAYVGETILERRTQTQAEIQEYFNLTKALYGVS